MQVLNNEYINHTSSLPVAWNNRLLGQGNVSLVLGSARSARWDIWIWVGVLGQFRLCLLDYTLQFIGVGNVFVGFELRSDFDGFSSVGVKFERRVKGGSQRLSEQGRNTLAVRLGEGENGLGHAEEIPEVVFDNAKTFIGQCALVHGCAPRPSRMLYRSV